MTIFRVLHVTDLHIAIPPEDNHLGRRTLWQSREHLYPSCANPYALEAIAEFISARRREFDLILMTGDIADDGLQRNLDAACHFVTSTLDAGRVGGPPFFILPGNHDRFEGVARRPGGIRFDMTFKDYWNSGLGGVQSAFIEKGGRKLALLGADLCLHNVRKATNYLGQGRAYKHIIQQLVQRTTVLRDEDSNVGIVWVTHFPPLLDVDNTLRLLSAERLLHAATASGVQYIIGGHLHRNQTNRYSTAEVICTGSASSTGAGELYGNWISAFDVEVTHDGIVSVTTKTFQYIAVDAAFA
jgi:DNA repair exonuclease SbcCD nuclease subunit